MFKHPPHPRNYSACKKAVETQASISVWFPALHLVYFFPKAKSLLQPSLHPQFLMTGFRESKKINKKTCTIFAKRTSVGYNPINDIYILCIHIFTSIAYHPGFIHMIDLFAFTARRYFGFCRPAPFRDQHTWFYIEQS